ncbi:biotin--[acetyl-CoA-carboxylase] ligase [Phaeodactylibacter luteus]|uniref:biotin--[acetyl-CoA-carboxylase] ligase n=1 Tax=Phaeodactylibacter luteus TaxID=1564516 RepID=UPI0021CE7B0A|nr:biotin--[acetyl-CoA-carboxylase] ligase [Phaeodactylibacter luteus]
MQYKNTLFIGKVVHAFSALPSTNSHAQELLSKSTPIEGTVITAAEQTAGRGQIGSRWYSPASLCISMSVILYPRFLEARRQFGLNIIAALAVRDTVQHFLADGPPCRVKWPNDVYLAGKKVAGILIQNQIAGRQLQHTIIGIGLNVNVEQFPPALPLAISLRQAGGALYDLWAVEEALGRALEQRYLALRGKQIASLQEEYYENLLGYGESCRYLLPGGREVVAVGKGVDEDGRLRLWFDGQEQAFGLKEIQWLPD